MNYIKSVSLTKEHAEMVEREHISLSGVLRKALDDINLLKSGELVETNASLIAKIQRLMDTIQRQAEELEQFRGKYNVLEAKA